MCVYAFNTFVVILHLYVTIIKHLYMLRLGNIHLLETNKLSRNRHGIFSQNAVDTFCESLHIFPDTVIGTCKYYNISANHSCGYFGTFTYPSRTTKKQTRSTILKTTKFLRSPLTEYSAVSLGKKHSILMTSK